MSMDINKIYCGDCVEVMKTFPGNTFDAIVTDPPYFLKFMSKDWDTIKTHDKPKSNSIYPKSRNTDGVRVGAEKGAAPEMQDWHYKWAIESLRVAKPGAHMLVFGGTRTHHRLMVGVEDAGWEIRDTVMWVYGCISEDTEILTENGWELYHKNINKSHALTYNIESGEFAFEKPKKVFLYKNEHPAYSIKSDFTDQIVSRQHRCIVKRSGMDVFRSAETLQFQESIPFLESLSELPYAIPYLHKGTSITKSDLLDRVQRNAHFDSTQGEENAPRKTETYGDNVCCVRYKKVDPKFTSEKSESSNVQQTLQRNFTGSRMEEICTPWHKRVVTKVKRTIERAYDRIIQSCMERGRDILQNTWKLCRGEICEVPERISQNGTERWLCNGAQINNGTITKSNIIAFRSDSPYRSRSNQQPYYQSKDIQNKSRSQSIRRTNAEVKEINYDGYMWCIQVTSGAFVARRNGKIFITGNSGFPKSLDISKQLDKMAGVDREIVGRYQPPNGQEWNLKQAQGESDCHVPGTFTASGTRTLDITAPVTDAAKQWNGWGTALKPAWEPIILARKPVEGTVAENVQKWGTGAINIDACRVPTTKEEHQKLNDGRKSNRTIRAGDVAKGFGMKPEGLRATTQSTLGRFPANLILSYPDDEYILREDITSEQLRHLTEWINENPE